MRVFFAGTAHENPLLMPGHRLQCVRPMTYFFRGFDYVYLFWADLDFDRCMFSIICSKRGGLS